LIDIQHRSIVRFIDIEYRSIHARSHTGQRRRRRWRRRARHTMTTLTTSTTTRVVRRRWTTAQGHRAMRAVSRGAVAMDGVEAIPRRKGARARVGGGFIHLAWCGVFVAYDGRARPWFSFFAWRVR